MSKNVTQNETSVNTTKLNETFSQAVYDAVKEGAIEGKPVNTTNVTAVAIKFNPITNSTIECTLTSA
jgi:hypothetical protein